MLFSFNKKSGSRAGRVVMLAALALTVFLGGCSEQKVTSGSSNLMTGANGDSRLLHEDFAFPSQTPSLMQGREIYQSQCMQCHVQSFWQTPKVKSDLAYSTPIDLYLMLTTGEAPKVTMATAERRQVLPAHHESFREKINRDGRWAVLFYARYLAGAGDITSPDPKTDMAAIFGGNCAVCHGPKGQGDGPLYTGKTGNHELHDAVQTHNLNPAPANFQQYSRIYNRTDAQLFKYLCEGIYPSAMPAWYGDVNRDKDTGKITYIFDERLLTNMTRYIRTKTYNNDLTPELPEAKMPPKGLDILNHCSPVPTNHPWTNAMRTSGLPVQTGLLPKGDPITGGMVERGHHDMHEQEAHGSDVPAAEVHGVNPPASGGDSAAQQEMPMEGHKTP
jgi:mono/diheme cytochrome c family protein